MNKIYMQYPFGNTNENPLLDGAIHQITPQYLFPIQRGDRTFYIMEYFDYNGNSPAITLVTDIGGTFAKIPLDDYECLFDYMEKNPLERLEAEKVKLPQTIMLGQTLQTQALLYPPKNETQTQREPVLNLEQYVPINVNGATYVSGGTYYPRGISTLFDIQTYHFSKAESFSLKDRGLERGLHEYYIDENGFKKYDFEIFVPNGTTGEVINYDDQGIGHRQRVLIIPGRHSYHVTYADFVEKDDYNKVRTTEKLEINNAPWPEYYDLHDKDKAFTDGGNKTLNMTFIDYIGRQIPSNSNVTTKR